MGSKYEAVYVHPIRTLPIISYQGDDDAVAFIGDGKDYSFPYFRGLDRLEAEANAEAWRQKVIDENERSFIERTERLEKSRALRKTGKKG